MTVETKTTIQLSDLTSIEFECKDCGATTSWPMPVAKNPPTTCRCRDEQWMTHGGQTYRDLSNLIELIQRLGKADGEKFVMRFRVTNGLQK